MDENKPEDTESGYVHQKRIVDLMVKNGFKLEASSEMNSNPKDTKDHPEGVWTLPPSLALGADESAKYLAIGESDRMTLKFVKP
jgi:predicted methyltransferase